MAGARAERNEYLLLHEFHKRKFICPDKAPYAKKPMPPPSNADDDDDEADDGKTKGTAANKTGAAGAGKRKPQYAGGLVLDPKRGFYEKFVIMLDFNSLYPSIIQEYNICFTTVNRTSIVSYFQKNKKKILRTFMFFSCRTKQRTTRMWTYQCQIFRTRVLRYPLYY